MFVNFKSTPVAETLARCCYAEIETGLAGNHTFRKWTPKGVCPFLNSAQNLRKLFLVQGQTESAKF
jgi:hypothetical protein